MLFSIIIADAYPLMAEGLEKVLSSIAYIEKICTCHTYAQLKKSLAFQKPDILVLHAALDKMDEHLLYQEIRSRHSDLKVLLISETTNPLKIKKLYSAHLNGFLLRKARREDLIEAINIIINNQIYVQEEIKTIVANHALKVDTTYKCTGFPTRREKEVLQLIVKEYTTREIAKLLFISPDTVETHRLKLIQKLKVKNTAGLVREAINKELID